MNKSKLLSLIIIFISFIIGVVVYPFTPNLIASHWGLMGEVNGYISKPIGLFLMPIIGLIIYLLFILVPFIDPLKRNISKFKNQYENFIFIIILFLFYIYVLTILWNLGIRFMMGQVLLPAFSILFYYCGVMLENAKQNWFIGIRTPWTLTNEKVWNKTNQLTGKLYKISAVVGLSGMIFPIYSIFFVLIPIIFSSIFAFFYSYFEYNKIVKK